MIHWVFARVYKKIELFKVRLTVRRDTLVSRFDCQVCFYKETRLWGVDQSVVSKSLVFNARLADQAVGGEWKLLQTIIIAVKGAIRDFWQSPHCTSNRRQHVRSSDGSEHRLVHRSQMYVSYRSGGEVLASGTTYLVVYKKTTQKALA